MLTSKNAFINKVKAIEINADKITSGTISADRISTSSLSNIELGGTNLFLGSKDYSGAWANKSGWNITSDTHKGTLVASRTGAWNGLGQVLNVVKGEQYTFSAYVKSASTGIHLYFTNHANPAGATPASQGITLKPNTWTHVVFVTSITSDGLIFPRFESLTNTETLYVSSMKLEMGNKATGWSPAPEDVVNDLGSSGKVEIHGGNIKADTLNVSSLTGNTATFISGGVKGLNSNMSLDGGGMTIQDSAGNTASISSTPDFKAIGSDGTAVYMTKGNVDFAADGAQKFKIGTKVRGSQNGILINKGHGWALMRESDTFGGSPAQYHRVANRTLAAGASATIKHSAQYVWTDSNQRLYMTTNNVKGRTHTVETVGTGTFAGKYKLRHPDAGWGITGWVQASDIVETTDTWRQITTQYYNSSTSITTVLVLNGSSLPANTPVADLPELTVGMNVLVKNAVAGNTSGVGSVFEVWSEGSNNIIQFDYIMRHSYDLVKVSDRRLKHDIEESLVKALDHIDSLSFKRYKWNRDGSEEEIGLIAQDSGIIRTEGETEGINTTKSVMLTMKGVQELHAIVKEQAEEIRQLKEIINQ